MFGKAMESPEELFGILGILMHFACRSHFQHNQHNQQQILCLALVEKVAGNDQQTHLETDGICTCVHTGAMGHAAGFG